MNYTMEMRRQSVLREGKNACDMVSVMQKIRWHNPLTPRYAIIQSPFDA
jgi:hypothetical protein